MDSLRISFVLALLLNVTMAARGIRLRGDLLVASHEDGVRKLAAPAGPCSEGTEGNCPAGRSRMDSGAPTQEGKGRGEYMNTKVGEGAGHPPPDLTALTGMDYSPARRKPPIHN